MLVTSLHPLEVFIYKEGFARLSTEKYTLDDDKLKDVMVHLTNYSIQKKANQKEEDYNNFEKIPDVTSTTGSKLTLKELISKLDRMGINFESIWTQVCQIVIKTLYAAQNDLKSLPNSFELFGYDILIDSDLKCWLIEVNSSPSLHRETLIDDIIKQNMIDDIVDLVDAPNFNPMKLLEVLNRRVGETMNHKSKINTTNNSKAQLNRDLTYILEGKRIRKYGEMPEKPGLFQMISPSDMASKISSLLKRN